MRATAAAIRTWMRERKAFGDLYRESLGDHQDNKVGELRVHAGMTYLQTCNVAFVALIAVAVVFGALVAADTSRAATFGELGRTGSFSATATEGDFRWPSDIAVDPADNSVYVVDRPEASEPETPTATARIQKFGSTLAPVASVTVPTPIGSDPYGTTSYIAGIAIDPTLERVYVLEDAWTKQSEPNQYAAYRIVAYSTKESAKTLSLASNVETGGEHGVFYVFPKIPTTGTPPSEVLRSPQGISVEPGTHDLIVVGIDSSNDTAIQRIGSSGPNYTSGKFEAAYEDSAHAIGKEGNGADGVTVPAEGMMYLLDSNAAGATSQPGVVEVSTKAPATLANPKIVVVDKEQGTPGARQLTGGKGDVGRDFGAQIAAPTDQPLLYAVETSKEEEAFSEPKLPGEYEIRGMSTAEGAGLGSQQIVYGGKAYPEHCSLTSAAIAVAAGSNGIVYVLDEGDQEFGGAEHTAFGFDLVKFGPNGSNCPTPSASFTINGDSASEVVSARKGEVVSFDASDSQLNDEEPVEVDWALNGTGKPENKVTGKPASLKITERYITPGTYTIGMKIVLSGNGAYGNPPLVTRKLEIKPTPPTASFEAFSTSNPGAPLTPGQVIKPGENITFNAESSVDPTGECTQQAGCKATNKLKSYVWTFGDGKMETTTSPDYVRSFANSGQSARVETVSLTVVNEEEVQSIVSATATLTVEGVKEAVKEAPKEPIKETVKEVSPIVQPNVVEPPTKRPLTRAQKLAMALRACKKDRPKRRRLKCERMARNKYRAKSQKRKK